MFVLSLAILAAAPASECDRIVNELRTLTEKPPTLTKSKPEDCGLKDLEWAALHVGRVTQRQCLDCVTSTDGTTVFRADGPQGSGRHWDVGAVIMRGGPTLYLCERTSTAGFRHIADRAEPVRPLEWFVDLDGDQKEEFVLWTSRPMNEAPLVSSFYLFPAVYERKGHTLVADPVAARPLLERLASVYGASPFGDALRAVARGSKSCDKETVPETFTIASVISVVDSIIIVIDGRTGSPMGQGLPATLIDPDGKRYEITVHKESVPGKRNDQEAFMVVGFKGDVKAGWRFARR